MFVTAIDPGTEQSAIVVVEDVGDGPPNVIDKALIPNWEAVEYVRHMPIGHDLVIEMIACYGQRVGREVFETCVWIGRFMEAFYPRTPPTTLYRMTRSEVKLELCNTNRASDADIRAVLIDIYGPGKDKAVGVKASPGPLYGFRKDMWAALGVAVAYCRLSKVGGWPDG